ncbi:MAG: GNAT family N-acetyltransferase [Candidatus Riflebacteria bacterium]|nr:GNAT family N-acetyltransferase [Candidatus Riflebacteria bacterium]
MQINNILINSAKDLVPYRQKIADLFLSCFKKPLMNSIWDWAYQENPSGKPIVTLGFDEDRLVGHYAAISFPLRAGNSCYKSFLSMTTMVEFSYRKYHLFYKLATLAFDEIKRQGGDFVFGFPNFQSLPGFRHRLGWQIYPKDYVACLSSKELEKGNYFLKEKREGVIEFDVSNKEFLAWRLSKPGVTYVREGELIFKDFQNSYDVVRMGDEQPAALLQGKKFNLLLDGALENFKEFKVFDYPFGWRWFQPPPENVHLKKELLLSDVF